MKHLIFNVNSQSLQRVDNFKPAAGSVEYLTAFFEFNSDWSGTSKTAKCRAGAAIYNAVISSDGFCVIPWEVLAVNAAKQMFGKQDFYIYVEGVNGSKTITTNEVKIELNVQGAGSEQNAGEPTPSAYAQFIEDVKAETKASADTATAKATEAATSAESAAASAASLKNDYSNALKGNASGAVVRVDDVSPVEHYPVVKVHGKNLWDMAVIENTSALTVNSNGTITIGGGKFYCPTNKTLSMICPSLKVGNVVTFSIDTDASPYIYLSGKSSGGVGNKKTMVITEDMLTAIVVLYGAEENKEDYNEPHTINNIQLEYGETATEYTPYVDPSTVTVTDSEGNTYTPNTDGTVEGITSTMIENGISTDTEGMTIECEYNRDINKVIADIITQLAGG